MVLDRFTLLRPWLLFRDLVVNRDRPDLDRLRRIEDPERFLWAILPHAARTFSACIAVLPSRAARAAAVAYLYCRMLDTYEDLLPDPAERAAALGAFAARFGDGRPAPAPPIGTSAALDERDESHLLLVERARLVDEVYADLEPAVRGIVADLVHDMAEGMRWSSERFVEQDGVLVDDGQVTAYCRHVIGNPVVFVMRLLEYLRSGCPDITPELREDAMRVGELVQLANVTRDIEKDLARGIAYAPELKGDLGRNGDAGAADRVRAARSRLMRLALGRAPSYARMVEGMRLPRVSLARASALLMLLFTDRYWRGCARRAGLPGWGRRPSGVEVLLRSWPAVWSRTWTERRIAEVTRDFLRAARR